MKNLILIFCASIVLYSCGKNQKSALIFSDHKESQIVKPIVIPIVIPEQVDDALIKRKKYLEDKKVAFEKITTDGKETFKNLHGLLQSKCFACHDANTKLPIYGNILKKINPVNLHRVNGLKALDFSKGYPLIANGNPPQISLLKAIRSAVTNRTMPLKAYTFVFPSKKIKKGDQDIILDQLNLLISEIEDYEDRYNSEDKSLPAMAQKILENKCYRCHANGNNKGGFGEMENSQKLLNSKYVNLNSIDHSLIYEVVEKSEMPPSKLDSLTSEELSVVRDWLDQESKKNHEKNNK